jgi:phosphoribosyl-ATP pyrophosphohydrolase
MKRFKRIFVLLGVLAVACIVTIIVMNTEEKKERIKNTDEVILSVSAEDVQSLSWSYGSTSLGFHKEETWIYDEDEAFPVDEDQVENLISVFENFGAAFIIEEVEDYSQYGLDDPVCTIDLATADQTYEITLGDYSTMDSQRYVSIGDGNVYLVKNDPFDSYELELSDMIKQDTATYFDSVEEISLEGAETYEITYEEDSQNTYCSEDVYFTTMNGKTVPLDTDNVEAYWKAIRSLKLTDYVSYNVTEEELADWGLDSPWLTVTINGITSEEEEATFVLHIGLNQEELAAREEAEEAGEDYQGTVTAYVRVGESQIVYEISESTYNTLAAVSYNDLRHEEVLTADFADITQIDITLEGQLYTLTSEEEDGSRVYYYGEDETDLTSLSAKVEALTAEEFTEEQPEDKEEISLTFYLDNENYPQVTVTLYRYDGTNCIAVVDGETMCLVSRTSVVNLIEAVNGIILG